MNNQPLWIAPSNNPELPWAVGTGDVEIALVRTREQALLFKTAPKMFEVLQDCAMFLDYVPGTHPTSLVEKVRAVITKATGGT